jgi:hypothetical protein
MLAASSIAISSREMGCGSFILQPTDSRSISLCVACTVHKWTVPPQHLTRRLAYVRPHGN